MESAFTFFIIFHKTLFAKNTERFTEEERRTWFRWYAVNESIEKKIPDWLPKDCLLEEYKLSLYDPELQRNKSYQNSCFFHLHWNPSLVTTKYVGFAQYDMSIDPKPFREAVEIMKTNSKAVFGMFSYPSQRIFSSYSKDLWERYVFSFYNSYYNTNHSFQSVQSMPLALLHTFIVPTDFFHEMMVFMDHLNIWQMLGNNNRHYAGTMERVFALYINLKILEGRLDKMIFVKGFSHNDSQRAADAMRGIKGGVEDVKGGNGNSDFMDTVL